MQKKGIFISLEGNEACGKTTQQKIIVDYLQSKNIEVLQTREPGGTNLGEKIRNILLHSENEQISPISEALLLFAARNHHINNVIKPALDAGIWVISDRFIDSSYAYQGAARGLDLSILEELEKISVHILPDICFYFAGDWQTSQARQDKRGNKKDRFELTDINFFNAVEKGFTNRAQTCNYMQTLDSRQNIENISQQIFSYLDKFIINEYK